MTPLRIELPRGFRSADILSLHQRDAAGIAERVDGMSLRKGLIWHGHPACLGIHFETGHALAELAVDGDDVENGIEDEPQLDALQAMVRRMLGLSQGVEEFELIYREHTQLGPLIARQYGLRVPLSASPFEALTWAITGQQISVSAAISMRRRLIEAAGTRHSNGLICHPDAHQVARMSEEDLRGAGFSRTKASTLIALSGQIDSGELPLDAWLESLPVDEIRTRLLAIRGIGPWTVNYALLRGYGWLDGSLHGDVAVRRSLQQLLGSAEKIGEEQARVWLQEFSPWRALVAAHLWAMHAVTA